MPKPEEKSKHPWHVRDGDSIRLEYIQEGHATKYKTVKVTGAISRHKLSVPVRIPGTNHMCRHEYKIHTDAPEGYEWGSFRTLTYKSYEMVEILVSDG